MSEYTEGIQDNTVLILKDGLALYISDILQELNKGEALKAENALLRDVLKDVLPLAKGYAPQGQTESAKKTCRRWIRNAQEALKATE